MRSSVIYSRKPEQSGLLILMAAIQAAALAEKSSLIIMSGHDFIRVANPGAP